MKTIGLLGAMCLLSLLFIVPLHVADSAQPWQLRLGTTIIGSNVKNLQGKDLGSIKELVVNPADNRVVYAVLASGGMLGLGEKMFAVPLSVLQRAAEGGTFLLNVDEERLKQAPEFNQNNWPQMTDPQWVTSVYTFYGVQPYWK